VHHHPDWTGWSLYRICLDSAGLAPGQYIAYIGCGDLETHAYEIEIIEP